MATTKYAASVSMFPFHMRRSGENGCEQSNDLEAGPLEGPMDYRLFAMKRGERPRSLAVRRSLPRGEAAQQPVAA
jgi:hypothetical protein